MLHKTDVVIWDSMGLTYFEHTDKNIGGTEFAVIRLVKSLKVAGKNVLLLTGRMPPNDIEIETDVLILIRNSSIPPIKRRKTIVWAHDSHVAAVPEEPHTLVCLSKWQADTIVGNGAITHRTTVIIPGMLPDCVYTKIRPPRELHRWMYASAAVKGWAETYEAWKAFRIPGDKLRVMSSGYDHAEQYDDPTLEFLPVLNDEQLVDEICRAEGLFAVNVKAETFGATLAMADQLGTPVLVYAKNGAGGAAEVLSVCGVTDDPERAKWFHVKNYRIENILPVWLELING
jgi:hypothetical protein